MNALLYVHVALLGLSGQAPTLLEGDLVFQESRSSQARAVQAATGSPITHMGIVTLVDGRPHVFEAVSPATGRVGATPLSRWRARGVGGKLWVKRISDREARLTPEVLARMTAVGESFLGRRYDPLFQWDKRRMYCSELVYDIYLVGAGISLGRVQQIGDLNLTSRVVQRLIKARMKDRLDKSELIITPASIFGDPDLVTISAP
jgi:hypothetical protein